MPQNTPEYRVQLMQEGRHAELFEALRELLEITPDDPGLLYNVGLSAYLSGQLAEAASYWSQLKARAPQHLEVRAKLVQVYEALQDPSARDAEREGLLALYNERKADPQRPANYCRDQFTVGDWAVRALENFEFGGDMAVRYTFYVFRPGEERPAYWISLGSYAATNQYMRERGQLQPDERLFHLDEYRPGGAHRSLGFYKGEPPYDFVKRVVQDVLRQT
jgi:tetratricopeptide (TPR) repeat protein